MLFWSIPILIGIWISGKFDDSTIFAFIVIIFLFVALSYLFVGSKRFEGVISQNKVILTISLCILIVVIFLWQFYAPISSFLNINFEVAPASWLATFPVIVVTVAVLVGFTIMLRSNVPEMLARRNFVVVIPTVEFNKNFSPEGEIVIPYSLENRRSDVITEIGVSIFAPGLLVLSEKRNILYKSIGGKSTENGELKLLYIPKEAVPGEYTVELNWSFYVGSEKYRKTNEIKVNVVL